MTTPEESRSRQITTLCTETAIWKKVLDKWCKSGIIAFSFSYGLSVWRWNGIGIKCYSLLTTSMFNRIRSKCTQMQCAGCPKRMAACTGFLLHYQKCLVKDTFITNAQTLILEIMLEELGIGIEYAKVLGTSLVSHHGNKLRRSSTWNTTGWLYKDIVTCKSMSVAGGGKDTSLTNSKTSIVIQMSREITCARVASTDLWDVLPIQVREHPFRRDSSQN